MLTTIADERQSEYKTPNEPEGKPWRCLECKTLLGYIRRVLITIQTSSADEPLGERTITRQGNTLQRIGPRGERGDLIIGDADIRCATCDTVRRWDYRRGWEQKDTKL